MGEEHKSVENNAEATLLGGCTGKGFKPGQSGNPGGRPKKKPITELYEQILRDPKNLALLEKIIVQGIRRGDVTLIREMADRVEGKVTQQLEHSGRLTLEQLVAGACEPEDEQS